MECVVSLSVVRCVVWCAVFVLCVVCVCLRCVVFVLSLSACPLCLARFVGGEITRINSFFSSSYKLKMDHISILTAC